MNWQLSKASSFKFSNVDKLEMTIIVIIFFFMLLFEGALRWFLGVLIFAFAADLIGGGLFKDSKRREIWGNKSSLDEPLNTRLESLDKIIEGAVKGKKISQALLEQKIIELIQRKLDLERGISRESFKELLKNPEELKKVIDDEVIYGFMMDARMLIYLGNKKRSDERSHRVTGQEYRRWIEEVLDRVEVYG